MQKIYRYIACLASFAMLLASCKKEGDQFNIRDVALPANVLKASKAAAVLTRSTENDTVLVVSWTAADFGKSAAVTYTLQFTVASDTSGANAWSKAKSFNAGNNVLKYSFVTKDLNSLLNEMRLPTEVANSLVFRIKSDVNQYNNSASRISSGYSNQVALQITPYKLTMYIPGAYQGWDPSKAPEFNPVTGKPGLYEAYEYMPAKGQQYFKYTNSPDWNHTNYGDGGNGKFSTDGLAGGLSVPDSGYYELTANLNDNSWTATRTSWGVIGDASPGGWDNDTKMTYDATNQVWKVTTNMKAGGSFKFRANGGWAINFGLDSNGKLFYADNPFFGSVTLNNLTVAADGNYTLTLDLHISGKYTYSAIKN